ncbi:c-type cytochrome [Dasania marina]|uniref:c-type cytochrome n=1 Tax=Dasania marina TaxID=471499 RepID=UPI0003716E69|nr:cytochrome c [Dasania marina]
MKKSMMKFMVLSCVSLAAYNATAADINAGKAKSAMCAGCHGAAGVSAIAIYPNLAGQKAPYLEKQLNNFRSGSRIDPVMSAMAKPLSDTDIANLAAYFSSL